jgi:hypothetical protein
MGREARCAANWGERSGQVTVLLESSEVIVRGAFRARASLGSLTNVRVEENALAFEAAGEAVRLDLGATRASSWAVAFVASPPSLAKKLGVGPTTRLSVVGELDDQALREVAKLAATRLDPSLAGAEIVLVRTDDAAVVSSVVASASRVVPAPALWFVYRKGRNAPLGETRVRALLREGGWIDTKVAAVSESLTALRFAYRGS